MTDFFADLAKLQAPETELLSTSKTTTVEIRKPRKDEWIRVSPVHKPITFLVYTEDKRENSKTYLILPAVAQDKTIAGIAKSRIIYTVVNRSNETFLSLVGIGDDAWSTTNRQGHQQALHKWVRIASNMVTKSYDVFVADFIETPDFPDASYNDLLRSAFGTNVIDTLKHPVALELLGKTATSA